MFVTLIVQYRSRYFESLGNKKATQRIKATGKVLNHRKIKGINSQCSLLVALPLLKPNPVSPKKGEQKKSLSYIDFLHYQQKNNFKIKKKKKFDRNS